MKTLSIIKPDYHTEWLLIQSDHTILNIPDETEGFNRNIQNSTISVQVHIKYYKIIISLQLLMLLNISLNILLKIFTKN